MRVFWCFGRHWSVLGSIWRVNVFTDFLWFLWQPHARAFRSAGGAEKICFLRNKVYFDVHFHFPACKFACGVVFCNDTDGLPGKNTTKIKGLFNEQKFFLMQINFWGRFLIGNCVFCVLCVRFVCHCARFLSLFCVFLRQSCLWVLKSLTGTSNFILTMLYRLFQSSAHSRF